MTDAEYLTIISEAGEHLKKIVASENANTGKIIDNTLKLLGNIERQKRGLSKALAAKAKVVSKPDK